MAERFRFVQLPAGDPGLYRSHTTDREPKSGSLAASDIVEVLYAAYLSAERWGAEVDIPLDPNL